jgi:peptide/nickel transport system ATP-binding protein
MTARAVPGPSTPQAAPLPPSAPHAPPGDDTLVSVRGLKKFFPIRGGIASRTVGFVRAVDGVDLDIRRGKSMGLIGESGCGKTTVGRCILQLLAPTDGSVVFAGREITARKRPPVIAAATALFGLAAALQGFSFLVNFMSRETLEGLPYPLSYLGVPTLYQLFLSPLAVVLCAAAGTAASDQERFDRALLYGALAAAVCVSPLAALGTVMVLLGHRQFGEQTVRALRKDMQIVFQDPFGSLNPRMLVRNIVGEPLRAFRDEVSVRYAGVDLRRGRASNAAIERITGDLMARVGLNPEHLNRFPHEFSGGQRQRICVARALALKPNFVVLDEPTSALDVSVQAQILNLLKDLQKERGLTYLFISHHLAVIRHMCDDVAVMYLGKIVEQAPNRELFAQPGHPYTIALLSAIPAVDPKERRERIVLEGDVPSPANPPSGCRFHTRCMIALEREVVEVPVALAPGSNEFEILDTRAAARTVRLAVGDRVVDPQGTVELEVEERGDGGLALKVFMPLPPGVPVRAQYRRFRAECAQSEPALLEVAPGHRVACHFHREVQEALTAAEATGLPVGTVLLQAREPQVPPPGA